MTGDRKAQQGRRREDRRKELLETAFEVIRERGPHTSMEHVAARAGVSRPIIYRHFGDREGLAAAVADGFAIALRAELLEALASPLPPRDVLVAAVDTFVAFLEREPEVYRFLLRGPAARGSGDVGSFLQQVSQDVAVVLGERLRAAGLDSGAAEPWAYGIVGMVHSAGDWWIDRRPMPRARLVEYVTTLLWSGMSALERTEVNPSQTLRLVEGPEGGRHPAVREDGQVTETTARRARAGGHAQPDGTGQRDEHT